MNEELFKKKYCAEDSFMLVSAGSNSSGGMLISPFFDEKLEDAWLKLNNYDKHNYFVVEIRKYTKPVEYFMNFSEQSLEDFLDAFKFLEEMDEDSDDYFDFDDKIEIYNEIKEHCHEVLGKEYFE